MSESYDYPASDGWIEIDGCEELRAANEMLAAGIRGRNNRIDELTAENERLREALEHIARAADSHLPATLREASNYARRILEA